MRSGSKPNESSTATPTSPLQRRQPTDPSAALRHPPNCPKFVQSSYDYEVLETGTNQVPIATRYWIVYTCIHFNEVMMFVYVLEQSIDSVQCCAMRCSGLFAGLLVLHNLHEAWWAGLERHTLLCQPYEFLVGLEIWHGASLQLLRVMQEGPT